MKVNLDYLKALLLCKILIIIIIIIILINDFKTK